MTISHFQTLQFLNENITLQQLHQHFRKNDKIESQIKEIEIKLTSIEQSLKPEIQSAKDEFLQKLEQSMKYEQQLFSILSEQLKSEIKESLEKMLSGALLATRGQTK